MKIRASIAVLGFILSCAIAVPSSAQNAPRGSAVQAQNPQPSAQTAAIAPEQNYILGPKDVLQIDALGRTDFSAKAEIATDGTIQLPYLGTFPASNRSVLQLRDDITQALEKGGYFAKPIVQVEVVSYASRYVTVLGNVGTPGLVPVDRPYHLSEILARVGGIRAGGADHIIIRTSKGDERTLSVQDLATGGDSLDPYVQPGDKIYSPDADIFYIKGQVKAPGVFGLTPKMTLLMAIARGGGLTDQGSERDIKIIRKNIEITPKDLNVPVEPDDVIDVGESFF